MAGFWRELFTRAFTIPALSATFSTETDPMPVDRLIRSMMGSGPAPAIDRYSAMSVPAVQRGRNLICSISTLPLVQYGPDRNVARNPLLEQIDPEVPNVVTLAQTVEDLLFEGISWWRIMRWERDDPFNGYPMEARHLDVGSVSVNPPANGRSPDPLPSGIDPRGGVVWVDGKPVPGIELIRFDSPNPGLLKVAGRAIRRALLLDQSAKMYAENPRPGDFFTPTEGADPADDDEVRELLADWREARRTGSTAYVAAAVKYNSVDVLKPSDLQLVELQRQAALDIANALGLDPEDLGISTTSRTYQNAVDRRQDRINDVLSPYMRAITDRLSMGDVTRRGYVVRFDLDDYLRADPMTRWNVYEKAKNLGATTVEEIRAEERMPALTAQQRRELAQAPTATPAQAPEAVAASRGATSLSLSDDTESTSLTFASEPGESFAVDVQKRTITGLAVPFNQTAVNQGRKWRFAPDSLEYADLGRVKLLRDHDWTQALGRVVALTQTERGYVATFKVARGPEGDKALALAEDRAVDGLSIRVDPIIDAIPDPEHPGAFLVRRALLREVSLTAKPAFDDSRVTAVAASREEGSEMTDAATEPQAPAAPAVAPDNLEAVFSAWLDKQKREGTAWTVQVEGQPERELRPVVNPTRVAMTSVNEPVAYRFDRGGNFLPTEHVFSADLHSMTLANDLDGTQTDAGKRVMGLLQATFATATTDINELNPTIQRPDMYVDQRDYRTPLWDLINKGAPPNGVQPFTFPKFNSASGLVGDHTEGTEPTAGSFDTTGQTVTPTPLSGKAVINREVWDMGGNPAVSTLIFNQMRRGYREGLETAAATFLNTLTAATDINLNTGATAGSAPTATQLSTNWESALADLQFVRGYDFSAFVMEALVYKAFVAARDSSNRPLYPILNPMNANGTAASRFRTLDLGGVTGIPSWALTSTAGSVNSSWLFDPSVVHGWASAPQRLEFQYQVKSVELGIWGYKAFANSDIAGVRQVTYDTTT